MDAIECVAAALFGAWLGLSALYQTKRVKWVQRLKWHDAFALIPAWSFFAPNPGTTDTNLLYRDKLVDGNVTFWRQVRCQPGRMRVVWNPVKRLQKGISDLGSELPRYASRNQKRGDRLLIHPGFIALLTYISGQPHAPFTESTQFTLARSGGEDATDKAQITFVSNFHRL